jgi:hypothetical protein
MDMVAASLSWDQPGNYDVDVKLNTSVSLMRLLLILPIGLKCFLCCLFGQCINVEFDGDIGVIIPILLVVGSVLVQSTDWRCWCCECMSFHIRGEQRLISLTEVDAKATQEVFPGKLFRQGFYSLVSSDLEEST